MEALFTHPLTMAAGAALVSAPVIIHLINRMRFRRVRWAAMEFLLKAQKRMRRKLIIEQLLLLFLRCLLVFLAGVLLARFLGFGTGEREDARATAHVVVLDDSPSMGEAAVVEGRQTTPYAEAKAQVTEKIAPAAAQANTPQSMDVVVLSALDAPARAVDRLNDSSIDDLRNYLRPLQPAAVRVGLAAGLRKAKERLDAKGDEVAKVIHVVGDLRAIDWAEDGEAVKQLLTEYTANGIRVHLIDMAAPARREQDRTPRSGDNLGIVEFRPRSRVAAKFQPVDFELRVKNSGATEARDVQVRFLLQGRQNIITSVSVPSIPPYQDRTTVVTVPGIDISDEEAKDPAKRFKMVSAVLAGAEPGGIAADNVRHAVVEVRPRLSVLVLEGRDQLRDSPKGDGFYLRRLFQDAFGGIEWVDGTPADLDRRDLRPFAAVYLLNVPAVTESQREKLEAYAKGGGGVAFFLGPDVRPAAYRDQLYRNGTGLFPVPLPDEPSKELTAEQRLARQLVLSKRVLTRDAAVKQHPAVGGMYQSERGGAKDVEIERYFLFANIDRYWPVKRFGKWREDQSVRELYCLPNTQSTAEFEGPVRDALDKMKAKSGEPKFEKYRPYLDPLDRKIRETAAAAAPLASLATYLDRLLCDQINDGDPSEPVLREFWGQPELTDVRPEVQRLRDAVKYGDPLYLVKEFGRGRVAVFTTDAGGAHTGGAWTDWPAGAGAPAWLAVMAELHKFLSGGPAEENRTVGSALDEALDPARYRPNVSRQVMTIDATKAERGNDAEVLLSKVETDTMPTDAGALKFRFAKAAEPGVYLFTLTALSGANNDTERPEVRAYPFNVDASREGDLRRAARDDLAQQAPNIPVHSPDDTAWVNALKQKRDDFSTRRWLYLFILLVLTAEQAMAVRLSRHTRAEDVELHAPSAAAAFARGSPPAAAPAAEPAAV